MDDQFIEEIKKRKEQGQSERQMATELGVSRSRVRNALQDLKTSETGTSLVPEELFPGSSYLLSGSRQQSSIICRRQGTVRRE